MITYILLYPEGRLQLMDEFKGYTVDMFANGLDNLLKNSVGATMTFTDAYGNNVDVYVYIDQFKEIIEE
ncbi:hypothetical protein [Bacillus sp. UMB0728]|uniref:hypothetical protein n=1 Tax=Bacillus sp. UMB0728 TaxID=2066052 RepID=UPI00115B3D00|nr:hypothetical protein [Bacillus sp. UMB0728]